MSDPSPLITPDLPPSVLATRATAAVVDMTLVGLICFGVQWAIRLADPPKRTAALVFAAGLGLLLLIEMLTGWSLGKAVAGLSVRGRMGVASLVIRAIVRWVPVLIFLPSIFVQNGLLSLLIWGIALTLVCCYVATAYLTLVRSGKSPFDMAGRTEVVPAPKI